MIAACPRVSSKAWNHSVSPASVFVSRSAYWVKSSIPTPTQYPVVPARVAPPGAS